MKNRKKVWGLGMVLVGAAMACTPDLHELGDEPLAGGDGGSGGNTKAGSGSVVPKGGSKSSPTGGAGSEPSSAGAPAEPDACFSPTEHLELVNDPEAAGCECEGNELTCVEGGVPYPGAALECVDGHWKLTATTCDEGCFAPTETPALAIEPDSLGCPCNDDPPECVRTTYQGSPWDIAMHCVDGRWEQAEDGVCSPIASGCKVDGVSYPSGARRVPDPFNGCNTCDCSDGELVNCIADPVRVCEEILCDENSNMARRCLGCGPVDNCTEFEIGCLTGEGCESGTCSSPWCV